jgi:hypothetical protein
MHESVKSQFVDFRKESAGKGVINFTSNNDNAFCKLREKEILVTFG